MDAAKLSATVCRWLPDSHRAMNSSVSVSSTASLGLRVISAGSVPSGRGGRRFDALDKAVEQRCTFGVAVLFGVFALAVEDGQELDTGAEVGAGFAG